MKLYKLLPLMLLVFVFLPNSEAICCEAGCSPTAKICCTPPGGGPSVGYSGCFDATTSQYVCPGSAVGSCLACGNCNEVNICEWAEKTSNECNSCEPAYDKDGFPVNSQCSKACPSGKTKCADGTCQLDCNAKPECLNTNDGCCNPKTDLVCDPNCLASQDADCGGTTTPSHAECNTQQQCIQVSGEGTDLCTTNSNCISIPPTPSHKVCSAVGNCISISGAGTDTCTSNAQCASPPPGTNPSYAMCNTALQCIEVSGLGQDQCTSNENCAGLPPTPNHKTCSATGSCISVIGTGVNTCTTDSQCTIPPPPPPTICTPTNNDCCLPNNEGICDLDCVVGTDPNCQPPGSSLNDGICNANTDNICDINCIKGIDTPDCNSFAFTEKPNDGCLPNLDTKCDLDCPLDIDWDCLFPPGEATCKNNDVCEDFEGCNCNDCIKNPVNSCSIGLFCCSGVCSGDTDNDLICDQLDYCINVFSKNNNPENQVDTDQDCFINGTRSSLFGNCGDQCDEEGMCFDIYGSRQCCDNLAGSTGAGAFQGFKTDCPKVDENSLGCWDKCIQTDENNNIITFEIGQCIEGTRVVTKLLNNVPIESSEEPCTSIPLIPFYTNFSMAVTFLILVVYYTTRKRKLV